MPYGIIKVDQVTFTNAGVDQTISVSGIVASISGNITATGTISGNVIRGGTTVSGATVTGSAGQFGTITGNTAGFTTVTGTTVTGTTATFTSGVFTNISGGTHTITSGVFASGTAANPSITFQGDVNTGIYSPGADQVAISTNGTGRLFVDASGNVGVGSNAPLSAAGYTSLRLNGSTGGLIELTSAATRVLQIQSFGAAAGAQITTIDNGSSPPLIFGTNSVERLRITSAGLVGVGNSSPNSYNASSDDLVIGDHVGAHGVTICSQNNSSGYIMFADGTTGAQTYAGQITYDHTNNRLTLGTNDGTTGLTIDSSQRVGIGTSSPAARLHIASSSGSPTSVAAGGLRIYETTNNYGINIGGDGTSAYLQGIRGDTGTLGYNNIVLNPNGGSVGIGTTSVTNLLHLRSDSSSNVDHLYLQNRNGGANSGARIAFSNGTVDYGDNRYAYIGAINTGATESGNHLVFATNANGASATEKARIDSSGRLLVGTSSSPSGGQGQYARLVVQGYTGDGTAEGIFAIQRGQSSTSILSQGDIGRIIFNDNVGNTFAGIYCFADATPGTNDHPGRLVFSTTADGASSPTERMRIQSTGRVNFGSNLGSADVIANNVAGIILNGSSDNRAEFSRDGGGAVLVNRKTDDGALILFYQDGTVEGTISVSGTTVSYNGAHLSRYSQLPSGAAREEILRGTVLSNIDEMCEWGDEDNEQLNRMKVSDVEGDKNVAGVFQAWDDDDNTYTNDFYCAMTGDFIIRIGAGITVERGDLLMSAGDGTAKPQNDDIIRSKTIAKVTSTNVSCTYDDGSYCVPCVLMAC